VAHARSQCLADWAYAYYAFPVLLHGHCGIDFVRLKACKMAWKMRTLDCKLNPRLAGTSLIVRMTTRGLVGYTHKFNVFKNTVPVVERNLFHLNQFPPMYFLKPSDARFVGHV
jgi:hypothetical protein